MVWHEIFPTHEVEKFTILQKLCSTVLHNLATLFDNTNVVSKPEQSDQIVCDVFCQTFTKSCQITNNIAEIRPNICTFFSLKDLPNNGPNTNYVT